MLLFLDGVGLGPRDPERNPLAVAELPTLRALTGGRLLLDEDGSPQRWLDPTRARPIDARLGVAGRPQSGTGQTALLTGVNAARMLGRHFGPWVPTSLREMLGGESLFRRAIADGHRVAFANCYPRLHLGAAVGGERRPGAFPFAAAAAGALVRDESALRARDAVTSSITTELWREYVDPEAPVISAEEAGVVLGGIAGVHELTVFAHFDTDYLGHRGSHAECVAALERVDRFLEGLLTALSARTLLVITSDHGNLEEVGVGHTLNPVPLIARGPGAAQVLDSVTDLTGLAPILLRLLRSRRSAGGGERT